MSLLKRLLFIIFILIGGMAIAGPLEWGFTESSIPESAEMFLLGIVLVGAAAYGRKKLYRGQ